jgi:hypothetical protein
MRVHWLGWLAVALAFGRPAHAQVPTESAPPAATTSPPAPAAPSLAPAAAQDSGTYSLAWVRDDGAESCPPGRELAADVAQRLGRSPFDPAAPRAIEIRVERTATGFRSRVHVRGGDGSTLGRRMLASDEPSCAPLFSATALAVALLIDPDAALREPARSPAVAEFTEPEPPPPPPPAPPPPQPAAPAPTTDRPRAPARREHEVAAATLLGAYTLGLTPEGSPGAALQFGGRLTTHWGWSVAALYVDPSEASQGDVTFSVGLTAASAFVSFRPLPRGTNLAIEAGPWLGVLGTSVVVSDARPTSAVATSPGDFLFAALSAGVGFEATVSTNVFVTARGHLLAPLVRRQLSVSVENDGGTSPDPVWTQPPVAGLFSAGVGLLFF